MLCWSVTAFKGKSWPGLSSACFYVFAAFLSDILPWKHTLKCSFAEGFCSRISARVCE